MIYRIVRKVGVKQSIADEIFSNKLKQFKYIEKEEEK